ncbi:SUKH-4 family immunity protein [Couchioplanes azureus]|uniref:SUKH-4 family immunity protein n=1 Tax=Couchioplanes caeruleus TaxID=56438 RepID=UPI00166FD026|nr:SUKH-4 family immunity protein [Couchioplanes caeruleus]GGQ72207.1 hypothetical protein GCM10010166_47630 [Couchioplanes caeruleus subsp. azureus]
MPLTHAQLLAHWGARRIIYFPLDRFLSRIQVGPEAFPPDGAIPVEVPILFTVAVTAPDLELFSLLNLQLGEDQPTTLIVIGCVPSDPDMLFCLDPATGAIMLLDLDPEHPGYELVNTSFALFVEFLYRLDELIQSDPGGEARADHAAILRRDLHDLDPDAFEDPESWWSAAFAQLLTST